MSRYGSSGGAGGSRYPSAYGHTPSYRSYAKGDMDAGTSYPSALGSSGLGGSSRMGSSGMGSSGLGLGRSSALVDFDLNMPTSMGLGGNTSSSSNAASKNVQQSYSSYSSSALDGGRPKVEYSNDSTYRASNTGNSGVPHTSYAHSSQNYSSEDPYKNRSSNYSYNI
jgi:hypothetical protein